MTDPGIRTLGQSAIRRTFSNYDIGLLSLGTLSGSLLIFAALRIIKALRV